MINPLSSFEVFNKGLVIIQTNLNQADELALVEHLADNKELAYAYEEKSVNLFQQLGITETLPPEQCFRDIDRLKQEGAW